MNFTEGSLFKSTVLLLFIFLIVSILIIGKSFLIPLAWAGIISLASIRTLERFEKKVKINRILIIVLFILFILSAIILIIYFFYWEIRNIITSLPSLSEEVIDRLHQLSISIKKFGIKIPDHIDKEWITLEVQLHKDSLISLFSSLGVTIADIFLICLYLFFMLYYQGIVLSFIEQKFKTKNRIEKARQVLVKVEILANNYIVGLLLITLITFILNYIVLLIFQVKFAIFFALFVSILSLIPYLGYPLGTLAVLLFAIITKDNLLSAFLVTAFVYGNNIIQENILRPWLVGDQLKINAFMVFLFIIIGGMIWGIAGMVLFLPIVGIIKIFLESNRKTVQYAIFLSDKNYKIPAIDDKEEVLVDEIMEGIGKAKHDRFTVLFVFSWTSSDLDKKLEQMDQ